MNKYLAFYFFNNKPDFIIVISESFPVEITIREAICISENIKDDFKLEVTGIFKMNDVESNLWIEKKLMN